MQSSAQAEPPSSGWKVHIKNSQFGWKSSDNSGNCLNVNPKYKDDLCSDYSLHDKENSISLTTGKQVYVKNCYHC